MTFSRRVRQANREAAARSAKREAKDQGGHGHGHGGPSRRDDLRGSSTSSVIPPVSTRQQPTESITQPSTITVLPQAEAQASSSEVASSTPSISKMIESKRPQEEVMSTGRNEKLKSFFEWLKGVSDMTATEANEKLEKLDLDGDTTAVEIPKELKNWENSDVEILKRKIKLLEKAKGSLADLGNQRKVTRLVAQVGRFEITAPKRVSIATPTDSPDSSLDSKRADILLSSTTARRRSTSTSSSSSSVSVPDYSGIVNVSDPFEHGADGEEEKILPPETAAKKIMDLLAEVQITKKEMRFDRKQFETLIGDLLASALAGGDAALLAEIDRLDSKTLADYMSLMIDAMPVQKGVAKTEVNPNQQKLRELFIAKNKERLGLLPEKSGAVDEIKNNEEKGFTQEFIQLVNTSLEVERKRLDDKYQVEYNLKQGRAQKPNFYKEEEFLAVEGRYNKIKEIQARLADPQAMNPIKTFDELEVEMKKYKEEMQSTGQHFKGRRGKIATSAGGLFGIPVTGLKNHDEIVKMIADVKSGNKEVVKNKKGNLVLEKPKTKKAAIVSKKSTNSG